MMGVLNSAVSFFTSASTSANMPDSNVIAILLLLIGHLCWYDY